MSLVAALASAQETRHVAPEAPALAQGWAMLAKGDAAGAALVASQALARDPNNLAALGLAVDAELARAGASAALATYEKWLGGRKVDDAYALRRVARALLVETSRDQTHPKARMEALRALAADGDAAAAAALQQGLASRGFGETRALASMGDEQAVKVLISHLVAMPGGKTAIIDALGDSGSKLAVPPLKTLLTDQNDVNRAAAVAALGRLDATDAIPQIKPLLEDPVFAVKLKAAGALLRLRDSTGLPFLNSLISSEHAAIRVAAARELSVDPDAAWQDLVRTLANDPDPTVRLEAARLIAPYDPGVATRVLDGLMRDANIGIREAASGVMVEQVASSFATLRGLLRSGDAFVRAKAAGRILELTR